MSKANVFQGAAVSSPPLEREKNDGKEELLKLEKEFAEAIVKNDLEGIGRLVTDDWIIIDPDGEIVDRARFFEVIKSGALTHDMMESEDFRVRVYGDSAVVTGITRTKGQIHGTGVQHAGTGHRCFCEARWAMAMRADASHSIPKK
jgi:ketosteroid isomerase-like protein